MEVGVRFGAMALLAASLAGGLAGCFAASGSGEAQVLHREAQVLPGEERVREWCATCHAVSGPTRASEAPGFTEIAARPGRDEAWLRAFLDEDHFPMTTYRLFDHEKRDVAAFIASLAQR